MPPGEELGRRKINQIFMVGDHVDCFGSAFEVVTPTLERFEDGQELLVVDIVIELRAGEGAGVESDWVEFIFGSEDGEDCSEGVVGGISFNDNLGVRNPMGKNRSRSESLLERPEGFPTSIGEVPSYTFPSESGERNYDVRIFLNEAVIKVAETKEGLNVLDIPRFWPVQDSSDFLRGYCKSFRRQDIA